MSRQAWARTERRQHIDRYQYLLLMAGCLAITLPLELFLRARIYRHAGRLAVVLVAVVIPFLIWDLTAIHRGHWTFSGRYVTGWQLPGGVPVEELAFFVVIPICGLLTYGAVQALLGCRGGERE